MVRAGTLPRCGVAAFIPMGSCWSTLTKGCSWQRPCARACEAEFPSGMAAIALRPSTFDGNPYLDGTHACYRAEILSVALKVGRIRHLVTRGREPRIPDGAPGTPDRRDVIAVLKH